MRESLQPEQPVGVIGQWGSQSPLKVLNPLEAAGVPILRTPPDVLVAFLKAWDEIAKEESAKNPFFRKVLESQRAYAAKVVPAKRFLFPPYSFAANYYWPENKPAAKGDGKKK